MHDLRYHFKCERQSQVGPFRSSGLFFIEAESLNVLVLLTALASGEWGVVAKTLLSGQLPAYIGVWTFLIGLRWGNGEVIARVVRFEHTTSSCSCEPGNACLTPPSVCNAPIQVFFLEPRRSLYHARNVRPCHRSRPHDERPHFLPVRELQHIFLLFGDLRLIRSKRGLESPKKLVSYLPS